METRPKRETGFTLIELLVVIAIIALLMSIILPSLKAVKELASGIVCTNNQRSLAVAWGMYAEDNADSLVGGSTYDAGQKPTPYRWVEPPLLQPVYGSARATLDAALTLEQRLNGIRAGKLYPYIETDKIYHCPGDKTFLKAEPFAVYRSYAITGLMNGEDFMQGGRESNNQFNPIRPEYFRTVTLNGPSKVLKVAAKKTEIKAPGNKLVFMEEDVVNSKIKKDPQEYNKGSFVLLGSGYTWWDAPAGYHNDGGTFSYADGHADRRKWQDKDTLEMIKNGEPDPDSGNNEDLLWMATGYIPIP